jgi:hypothetical protein
MKTHQFERIESLLQDILEELKQANVVSIPTICTEPLLTDSGDQYMDLSYFFKNISESNIETESDRGPISKNG